MAKRAESGKSKALMQRFSFQYPLERYAKEKSDQSIDTEDTEEKLYDISTQ